MSYKNHQDEQSACLECGSPFHGRKDKHFCSLSCKNAYHNREQLLKRHRRAEILAALSRNYHILEALLREEKFSAKLEDLAGQGFDPAFVTGHRRGRFGHDDYACFDIWYYRSNARIFNIRRKVSGEGLSVPSPGPISRR